MISVKILVKHLHAALVALAFLAFAMPALALIPGVSTENGDPEAEAGTEQTAPIEQAQDAGDDERIAARISGIFDELPGFRSVEVSVNEGVVRLAGTAADAEAIGRAEAIAERVAGVVTIENEIERDLSVTNNLTILGQIGELAGDAMNALPLLAVAAIVAIAIGAVGYLIASLNFIWNRIAPNAFLAELIRGAIRFVFVVGGVVIALDMLGAGALLGAVLGGAGVIGIALGFAMRDTIENYVASLMLSLRQPFRPNDLVLIDDLEGKVVRLTSRATVLMTLQGNHLRIPNSQVFKAVILNYTRNPQRRLEFTLGVDADDDPRDAIEVGADTLRALPFILSDPEPGGRVTEVGDSNIAILFLGWVDQREADWFKSRSLAIASVKDALEEAGFALPEPIYRLRFDGRTDPLPIGRSEDARKLTDKARPKVRKPIDGGSADVRPEGEIGAMVEAERANDAKQGTDLLDPSRPEE